MEYRVLAELLRELHALIPLGGGRPFARLCAHLGVYGESTETWMSWHARAVERTIGLPSARVDHAYIQAALARLKTSVKKQATFHQAGGIQNQRIEERLHWLGFTLFGTTAVVVAIHFVGLFIDVINGHATAHAGMTWMTVVAAYFPALGAALAGINNQGEFARLAIRNQVIAKRLEGFLLEVEEMSNRKYPVTLGEVALLSMRVSHLMVEEVINWRVIVLHRPLVPPA